MSIMLRTLEKFRSFSSSAREVGFSLFSVRLQLGLIFERVGSWHASYHIVLGTFNSNFEMGLSLMKRIPGWKRVLSSSSLVAQDV